MDPREVGWLAVCKKKVGEFLAAWVASCRAIRVFLFAKGRAAAAPSGSKQAAYSVPSASSLFSKGFCRLHHGRALNGPNSSKTGARDGERGALWISSQTWGGTRHPMAIFCLLQAGGCEGLRSDGGGPSFKLNPRGLVTKSQREAYPH